MRKFEDDMEMLVTEATEMGERTLSTITAAVTAFGMFDEASAEEVMEEFDRVFRLDSLIEEDAIRILTLYQPTAVDTRTVATVLKMITYLERISKYGKNLAKAARFMADHDLEAGIEGVDEMGRTAVEMVRISVDGFRNRDTVGFDRLKGMDSELDALRDSVLRRGVELMRADPDSAEAYLYCVSVSRYLERVGDHAYKIAEKVTFMVTGRHVEIDG